MKEITDYWGGFLAGFTAGEGSFCIAKYNHDNSRINYSCRFEISLRDDDRAILEEIQRRLGIGTIYDRPARIRNGHNTQPQTAFYVCAIDECAELVELFEKYPLRAKKKRDFEIWKQAVAELQKAVDCRDADQLEYYFLKIREVRQYDERDELTRPTIVDLQLTLMLQ